MYVNPKQEIAPATTSQVTAQHSAPDPINAIWQKTFTEHRPCSDTAFFQAVKTVVAALESADLAVTVVNGDYANYRDPSGEVKTVGNYWTNRRGATGQVFHLLWRQPGDYEQFCNLLRQHKPNGVMVDAVCHGDALGVEMTGHLAESEMARPQLTTAPSNPSLFLTPPQRE